MGCCVSTTPSWHMPAHFLWSLSSRVQRLRNHPLCPLTCCDHYCKKRPVCIFSFERHFASGADIAWLWWWWLPVPLAVVAVGSALVLVPGSCPVVALAAAVLLVVLVLLLLPFWLTVSSAINNLQFLSEPAICFSATVYIATKLALEYREPFTTRYNTCRTSKYMTLPGRKSLPFNRSAISTLMLPPQICRNDKDNKQQAMLSTTAVNSIGSHINQGDPRIDSGACACRVARASTGPQDLSRDFLGSGAEGLGFAGGDGSQDLGLAYVCQELSLDQSLCSFQTRAALC